MLLSFINILKVYLSLLFGKGLPTILEAIVSLRRIEEFLLLEELPSYHNAQAFRTSENKARNVSSLNGDNKSNRKEAIKTFSPLAEDQDRLKFS